MERDDRNGCPAGRPEPKAEAAFLLPIEHAAHAVLCDRPEGRPEPRRPQADAGLSPEVIRRWLACLALAVLGLGPLAEPGAAMEPAAIAAVDLQS